MPHPGNTGGVHGTFNSVPSKPCSVREDVNKRGGGHGGDDEEHEGHDDAVRRQVVVTAVPGLFEHVEVVFKGAAASLFIRDPAAETQTSRCENESQ